MDTCRDRGRCVRTHRFRDEWSETTQFQDVWGRFV